MAVTIDNVYVQGFERIVRHLAQQSETKLRSHVTQRTSPGERHNWERLGPGEAEEKTGPRIATPTSDLPWSRRVSLARSWHIGETSEQEDPVQMLVDPNSNIARALAMGMKRKVDDIVIEAATADALEGDGATSPFPVDQTVGDGTTPISFDLVTEVQEKFLSNDIDFSEPKCFVVGPTQVRKLLQLTEQTSRDFVDREALMRLQGSGIVPNWMGFTWIMSTRLTIPAADQLDCLAFSPRAIGLQMNKDITARVQEDPSLSFAWRIYCHMTLGAVRVEDEHIVRAHVADTV